MAEAPNMIRGDVVISGNLKISSIDLPNNTVGNENIDVNRPISTTKLEHRQHHIVKQGAETTAANEKAVLHISYGSGAIIEVFAGCCVAAIGDSTVTIVLKKNGNSILSGTMQITSTLVAFDNIAGLITSGQDVYSPFDVFTVEFTVSAGTGTLPKGVFFVFVSNEASE